MKYSEEERKEDAQNEKIEQKILNSFEDTPKNPINFPNDFPNNEYSFQQIESPAKMLKRSEIIYDPNNKNSNEHFSMIQNEPHVQHNDNINEQPKGNIVEYIEEEKVSTKKLNSKNSQQQIEFENVLKLDEENLKNQLNILLDQNINEKTGNPNNETSEARIINVIMVIKLKINS